MLDEGAGSRDALEIADAIDFLGAELSATGARRRRRTSTCTCRSRGSPTRCRSWRTSSRARRFPKPSSKRLREERLAVAARGRRTIRRAAHPGRVPAHRLRHDAPLRHGAIGTAASLKAITAADLQGVSRRALPAGERGADRRRRRHRRHGRAAARDERSAAWKGAPARRRADAAGAPQLTGAAGVSRSTSRARRSRRSASAGSACRARRRTTSRCGC